MTPTQEVESLRESLCYLTDSPQVLETRLERALEMLRYEGYRGEPLDYEAIELWASLAATIAPMLRKARAA